MIPWLFDLVFQVSVAAVVFSLSLLFLGICVLAMMQVSVVWKVFKNLRDQRGNFKNRELGLSEEDVDLLPCYEFAGKESDADCAVCLESFEIGDRCRSLLLCKHTFHAQCVDLWLVKKSVCPICRSDVVPVSKLEDRGRRIRGGIGSSPYLSYYFM